MLSHAPVAVCTSRAIPLIAPPLQHEYDSGNDGDTETKAVIIKDEYEPLVISLESLDNKDTANDASEWTINENLEFTYLSGVTTDYIP